MANSITREQAIQMLREINEEAKALLDNIVADTEEGTTYEIKLRIRQFVVMKYRLKDELTPPQQEDASILP